MWSVFEIRELCQQLCNDLVQLLIIYIFIYLIITVNRLSALDKNSLNTTVIVNDGTK